MNKLITVAVAVLALALAGCSKRTLDMPSGSMEPTIPAGSKVTIDFAAYASRGPARFDIVAFRPPTPPDAIFVFRVIGLPGETVQVTSEAVLIDGKEVDPPDGLKYIPASSGINQTNLGSTAYFLLGDNTAGARDCRYLGPVEKADILGKVTGIEQAVAPYR
jgi:signal peptidase I